MKKRIRLIIIFTMIIIISLGLNKCEFARSEFILGDVNGDSLVNSNDLKNLTKHINESKNNNESEWILTGESLEAADINRDGKVNAGDVILMLRYLATKSNPYNIGTKHYIESKNNGLNNEKEQSVSNEQESISIRRPIDFSEVKDTSNININEIKEEANNNKIDDKQVALNIMQEKTSMSGNLRFEKEQIEIKTQEMEKLKVISDNSNEPITIKSNDTNVVELFGVGIAVGKNPGEAIITAEQGNNKAQCKVTVVERNEAVNNIKINQEKINLETGETAKLEAITEPANKKVKWTTSNNEIAEIKEDGTLVTKQAGTVAIYATADNKRATCIAIIKDKEIEVQEISFNNTELELTQGESKNIMIGISPSNSTIRNGELIIDNDNIKLENKRFKVNDEGVAEIKIQANKPGSSLLKAKVGEKETEIKIKVNEAKVEKITLDTSEIKMEENQLRRITASINPEVASGKTIKWTSSNETVAKVDENGLVTSLKTGEAIITAEVEDKKANCKVIVEKTKVSVREIKITQSITVKEDQETKVTVELLPNNATNREINVKLDNDNASIKSEKVTVGENGKGEIRVTGKKIGKSVLTVSSGTLVEKCNITINPKVIEVNKITLSSNNISVFKGKTEKIAIKIEPTNATNKSITISSNNSKITVNKTKVTAGNDGKAEVVITGKEIGESILTVKSGNIETKCKITIKAIPLNKIVLSNTDITMDKGATKKLTIKLEPVNVTNRNIVLKTSNSNISIDKNSVNANSNGKAEITITGKKAGKSKITVTSGNLTVNCNIVVNAIAEIIKLNKNKIDLVEENTAKLTATITPSDATNKKITWSSSDNKIATVDQNGQVKAIKEGSAIITATAGQVSAKCTINVKAKEKLINVLFIGNSKTFGNEAQARFQNLANAAGRKVHAERIESFGGRTLNTLSTYDSVKKQIRSKKWDYIVLQEQTETSIGPTQPIKEGCYNLIQYTKNNSNKNVIPLYNATWILNTTTQSTQNISNSSFESIRKAYGGKVVYSGNAFIKCSSKYPNIGLYIDDRHPSVAGQYLSACCIYIAIYGKSPVGIKPSEGNNISADNTKKLQQIAASVMGL